MEILCTGTLLGWRASDDSMRFRATAGRGLTKVGERESGEIGHNKQMD